MKVGQVIGSTDTTAAQAKDDPIHYRDVLATVYHNLGIDPHAMVYDVSGRPSPILPGDGAGDRPAVSGWTCRESIRREALIGHPRRREWAARPLT